MWSCPSGDEAEARRRSRRASNSRTRDELWARAAVIARSCYRRSECAGAARRRDALRGGLLLAGCACAMSYRFGSHGQAQDEERASFGLIATGDLAAMILDDSIDDAETQAGALSHGLGGIEGVENTLRIAYPRTGVGELNDQFVPASHGGNLQGTAAGFIESVNRVLNDLDKNLKQLVGIGDNARTVAFDEKVDLSLGRRTPGLQHLCGAIEQDARVHLSFLSRSLLGEAEEIGNQVTGAAGLIDDLAQQAGLIFGQALVTPELLGVRYDGVEGMIDLMRSSGDEIAKRGQLFFLYKLILQLLVAAVGAARFTEQSNERLILNVLAQEDERS